MGRKSVKVAKPIKKVLKSLEKSKLLKNKFTLYVTLLVSIVVVLMYISKNDWNSLAVLVAVGLLTNYFTKNMTITLGISILVSLIVYFQKGNLEGMETEEMSSKEGAGTHDVVDEANDPDEKRHCFKKGEDGKYVKNGDSKVSQENCSPSPMYCWSDNVADCPESFTNRDVPSSKPSRVDGDNDESEGDRIDYGKNLESAYDNLQNMLGKDGVKNLSTDTTKLIEEQKQLMKAMKEMGPIMKEANKMMESLNGMKIPNIFNRK